MDTGWLLLVYKIPPEPSARRVYIWRKLKRLGAILVHDAVWVLPSTARTREHFQWLAVEIIENGGEATLWEGTPLLHDQTDLLRQQFLAQVEQTYHEILVELQRGGADADLAELSRRYQQAKTQDYFQSALGLEVREALIHARGDD